MSLRAQHDALQEDTRPTLEGQEADEAQEEEEEEEEEEEFDEEELAEGDDILGDEVYGECGPSASAQIPLFRPHLNPLRRLGFNIGLGY